MEENALLQSLTGDRDFCNLAQMLVQVTLSTIALSPAKVRKYERNNAQCNKISNVCGMALGKPVDPEECR